MKQVSAIDRLQAHTELKHRGGGTATENMSILLFRKRGTAGRLKANQHGYRPRQASPVNCARRVEQNNKKNISGLYFIDRQHFGYFQIWKGAKEKAFRLTLCVRCVSAQMVCDGPQLLEGQKLRLCHLSHLSAKTFIRVGGITEAALHSSEVRDALRNSKGLGQKGPVSLN